uniref:Putative conserved secreted protein n=1 Tax=Ixodes ricinus TaxID=34613 RepID=V5ID81_IXORI
MRSTSIVFILFRLHCSFLSTTSLCNPTMKEIKCEVCRALVKESVDLIAKADPKKRIPVGSFRLRADGTQEQKAVLYAGSETHDARPLGTGVVPSLDNYDSGYSQGKWRADPCQPEPRTLRKTER